MEIIKNSHEATSDAAIPALIGMKASAQGGPGESQAYACTEITDNGPGISDENKQSIFKPFFTTKNGSGLGLATAKSVIESHGGTITIEDNPSGGARFIVRIPLIGQPPYHAERNAND
jgi:signal transduction histidine kinase